MDATVEAVSGKAIMGNKDTKSNERAGLSFWRKVGYGMGEAGTQFSWTMISSYLTIYYTNIVGLTPLVISAIMLIARIWDAINDPMFGSIAENTRSKWGRFRPYILFGAPVLSLFTCLTFLNLNLPGIWKIFWCAFTYILCGMAYTAVSISVGSLANSITTVNKERVALNSFKGAMGSVAGILMGAITMPMILFFGNGDANSERGYLGATIVFSLIAIPCLFTCVFSTKEVVSGGVKRSSEKQNVVKNLWISFRTVIKDKNTAMLLLGMLLFLTGVFGRLGIMAYYFFNVFENPALIAAGGTALQIGMLVPNFYIPYLAQKIDKKVLCCISCVLEALCCVGFFFAGEAKAVVPMVIISFLYGAVNFAGIATFSLIGEIIDDIWLKTGNRADGMIYSVISFSTKLGNAIGGAIGIIILGAVGFVANAQLSADVVTKMNAVINFGPALMFLLAIIPFAMIKMTNAIGIENEAKVLAMLNENK